jgi:uncharacterized protein YneF (UPF0154 family)
MTAIIAIILTACYIITFLVGRMVGMYEAKEAIMKILKDNNVI